jgi:predicted phage baseplate assembly protein
MPLLAPKLDDRTFQDIVDEAKKRIPHYTKEWTDHNVSDPGITLIELFAWMTEIILYRLNRVPDLHYVKFMEMLGITLQEPVPAKVPVTFWLSAPAETVMVIPAGTEISTTQTETEPPIVYNTDDNFRIQPPEMATILNRVSARGQQGKQYNEHNLRRLEAGFDGMDMFSKLPEQEDAFYFGFKNDLSNHVLGFEFDCDPAGGAGIDPTLPPYVWEASSRDRDKRWDECEVEFDTTKGLNAPGKIQIHLPRMGKYEVNKRSYYWVRLRIREITQAEEQMGMTPYQVSPQLRQVSVASWGGTVECTHAQRIRDELLGRSDGSPGQRFKLEMTPILKRAQGEYLEVRVEDQRPQRWQEVIDFASSTSRDLHYTLESVSGDLRFGPAVRQPDGTMKLFGAVPARGANLIFKKYRHGGGQDGNVQAGVINTLRTSIPYVARVRNRRPAWGGLDAESLESAMTRAPAILRSRDRAVTESDFEFLARQALPAAIGRVKCLQPRPAEAGRVPPGQIYVLVVPRTMNPDRFLQPDELQPSEADMALLRQYLDERRLLTTRVEIRAPAYRWASCSVQLKPAPGADRTVIESDVLSRLYRFLNPLVGGPDGEGWPFGRELFASDVYQALQGIDGVLSIPKVDVFAASPGGPAEGKPVENLEVLTHGVIASGLHTVEFV